ncbi:hypothetical protein QNH39_07760 [Neobacillus novalis]|uniref:Molybdopterin cofactor biosynthesis MoaD-related C-terminal domain-containing protein n=1 Tax=Neobacillus novalis TaxID=220687 RepID=A0AA95SE22_9BACI|nr:hypothetical protein [Neobacillus novalis]WHY87718.1 hypothetical protein QNH39_07760 [Neobacillus novalis]
MIIRDLEFRGINREHLGMYFEELGAVPISDSYPYVFAGDGWSGKILSEKEIAFTTSFKVNAVQVRFEAENEAAMLELIKQYRYKTTRIGG